MPHNSYYYLIIIFQLIIKFPTTNEENWPNGKLKICPASRIDELKQQIPTRYLSIVHSNAGILVLAKFSIDQVINIKGEI